MKKRILAGAMALLITLAGNAVSAFASSNGSSNVSNASNSSNTEVKKERKVYVTADYVNRVIKGEEKDVKKFVVLEAGWGPLDEAKTYKEGHIPGSIHVDIASIEGEPYWNIKTPEEVEKAILSMGVDKDTTVIFYGDDVSGTSRIAFAYLWAGVENVKVLNGGINAWKAAGLELETKVNNPTPVTAFGAKVPVHPEYILSIDEVSKKLKEDNKFKLVSIRSYDEFTGKTSGYTYIPKAGEPEGAVWGKGGSDPYHMEDYTNDDGTVIDMDQMLDLWKDLQFTDKDNLSFYCGTGWRATIPFLIMYENGYTNISLYDGGWFQWQFEGSTLPVQVGDPTKGDVEKSTVDKLPNDKAPKN